jgi:hypothetical protein
VLPIDQAKRGLQMLKEKGMYYYSSPTSVAIPSSECIFSTCIGRLRLVIRMTTSTKNEIVKESTKSIPV